MCSVNEICVAQSAFHLFQIRLIDRILVGAYAGTFTCNGIQKMISKRPAKFMFESGELIGNKIAYRPQDRIKKVKA